MLPLQESSPASSESYKSGLPAKKRRTPGACDNCKKKKIRCDSADMLGNRCSNCVQFSLECTHKQVSKTLGSAKGYVESLETRLEKMERLLNKLLPKVDLNKELENIDDDVEVSPSPALLLTRNDDDIREEELIGRLKRLHVDPPQGRFFGKSSGYQLVQTALDIRSEYVGKEWNRKMPALGAHRAEPWLCPPWHPARFETPKQPNYLFPDVDLQPSLIDAYFKNINLFFPLLHRPSFDKSLSANMHFRDKSFGGTLLLVCALGSRYSDDPRVRYPNITSDHSAGWKWFEQVSVTRTSFNEAPSLGELQNHALSVLFSQSTETPQGCWTQLGMALRMAQEVGAHRRRALVAPTVEDEQWKRVFWVLMVLDRFVSSFSGRQCVLQEEDYDVDLPIECDDEYWDNADPSLAFRQPVDKPSTITYFNCYLKLMDILATAMRAIYCVRKSALPSGRGAPYVDQKIIMDLDSAMNNWMDSVPDHLRWDSSPRDDIFLQQSATLYATYYHLQIFIHRPFIPSFRNPSLTTFPSLAICTNAARSCCHVLDIQSKTSMPLPNLQVTVFTAAVVLLLNIWNGKRSGVAPHPRREIDDVQKCLNILSAWEQRWCSAGRYRDILIDLASAGDLPFSRSSANADPTAGVKRPRDLDAQLDAQMSSRQNDGLNRYSSVPTSHPSPTDTVLSDNNQPISFPQMLNFDLPMYATDLGKLPVYGQFNFSQPYKRPRRDPGAAFSFASHGNSGPHPTPTPTSTRPVVNSHPLPENGYANDTGWNQFANSQDAATASHTNEPLYASHIQSEIYGVDGVPLMDDILSMWSSTPTGFELNDWGNYITSVDQLMRAPGPGTFGVVQNK